MYEITRLLSASAPKVKKVRTVAKKAVKVGATVRLHINGETYTVAGRDDRYKNAWFLVGLTHSFSRDVMEVL